MRRKCEEQDGMLRKPRSEQQEARTASRLGKQKGKVGGWEPRDPWVETDHGFPLLQELEL